MARLPRPFGPYALLKALGSGAMGDVHLARPFNPKRGIPTPVVIKRLHGELGADEDFVRRFKHEAEIAVNVDSDHVAKVYDVGSVGETLYIAMEYVPGWPLSKFLDSVIASGRHASVASVVDLIDGGLRGLDALHTAVDQRTGQPLGVVHRDISPKNLMVGEDGRMRLIDLGLGKSNAQDWKTATGVVMGSVGYMPPEQVVAEKVDHRADIYAMGIVLWEMLALRNYVKRGPIPAMLQASLMPEWVPASKYRPDLPEGLDEVIHGAIHHEVADRYQSSAEFLAALREIVPEQRTQGGTAALIQELFGAQKAERDAEFQALLAAPLPVTDDEPVLEQTKIFGCAPGVQPLSEEDMAPTTVTDSASLIAMEAHLGQMGQPPGAPQGHQPQMVSMTPQASMSQEAHMASVMSSINSQVMPPKQGISVTTAIIMVVLAVGLTILIQQVLNQDSVVETTALPVDTPATASGGIRATPGAKESPPAPPKKEEIATAQPPAEEKARPPEPPRQNLRPRETKARPTETRPTETRDAPPARPPPQKRVATEESVKQSIARLNAKADALLEKAPDKAMAIASLQTKATILAKKMNKSEDYEGAARQVSSLMKELEALSN